MRVKPLVETKPFLERDSPASGIKGRRPVELCGGCAAEGVQGRACEVRVVERERDVRSSPGTLLGPRIILGTRFGDGRQPEGVERVCREESANRAGVVRPLEKSTPPRAEVSHLDSRHPASDRTLPARRHQEY